MGLHFTLNNKEYVDLCMFFREHFSYSIDFEYNNVDLGISGEDCLVTITRYVSDCVINDEGWGPVEQGGFTI